MEVAPPANGQTKQEQKRYRLPGITREGIAQLSLLETALWPLHGGKLPKHEAEYEFSTATGRQTARVAVRAPLGLRPIDEYVLYGLLGSTLSRKESEPLLLATPYWMLLELGMETGGSQYIELRDSLLRLATASYENSAFYNPESREHEWVAFQFLSVLLPTVGGRGHVVDNERLWRVEWNPAFFRFCRATGGSLLFDLDLFRQLTPAARRLFLKLKDRFWRSKRVFMNVDDLTIHGLGFSAQRPLKKRKFDLAACMRELLEHEIISLGRGQTSVDELILRRGKGCFVATFYEGPYFRRPVAQRTEVRRQRLADDPLNEPLRQIGVDEAGIRRLLRTYPRNRLQRWVQVTDAAMHEKPQGFARFRASPAAFLIDGVQHDRPLPEWFHAHEKARQQRQWEQERSQATADEHGRRQAYRDERRAALRNYIAAEPGKSCYDQAFSTCLELYRRTEPHRAEQAASEAAMEHVDRTVFSFPEFDAWLADSEARTLKRS